MYTYVDSVYIFVNIYTSLAENVQEIDGRYLKLELCNDFVWDAIFLFWKILVNLQFLIKLENLFKTHKNR